MSEAIVESRPSSGLVQQPEIPAKYLVNWPQRVDGKTVVPVWEVPSDVYPNLRGCSYTPGLMLDCSPTQWAGMSKRAKNDYRKRQTDGLAARGSLVDQWKRLVVEAYDGGLFYLDDPGLSKAHMMGYPSAFDAVYYHLKDLEKAEWGVVRDEVFGANLLFHEDLAVGDTIYTLMIREYGKIVKVNKKSCRVKFPHDPDSEPSPISGKILFEQPVKVDIFAMQRLSHDDCVRLASLLWLERGLDRKFREMRRYRRGSM